MKNPSLLILCCLICLTSCISETEQQAAANAAALCGAEDYTVMHTKSEGNKALVVTLKHLSSTDRDEKITSTSALSIFGMISQDDYKNYDKIKIVIERSATTFEKTYDIQKLAASTPILNNLLDVFRLDENNQYTIRKEMIDDKIIKDSTVLQFTNILSLMDKDYGKLSGVSITGLSYDPVSGFKDNILVARVKATNGGMTTNYIFYVSLETKKIIYIGINQDTLNF